MNTNSDDLLQKLREQFFSDPDELVGQIELLASNLTSDVPGTLSALIRSAHNLKGSAQLSGFNEFGSCIHEVESLLQGLMSRTLEEEGIENCKILIRRLGTLIRKKFEALRDGLTLDQHREQATWEATIQSVNFIISNSASNSSTSSESPNEDVAPKKDVPMDDWGFGDQPQASVDSPQPPKEEIIPSEKKPFDVSQGWGIFDDTPSTPQALTPPTVSMNPSMDSHPNQLPPKPAPPIEQAAKSSSKEDSKEPEVRKGATSDKETYLLCHHDSVTYALPAQYVQEIMPDRKLKLLPIQRKNVAGVLSFRGQIMPILNLLESTKLQNAKNDASKHLNGCIVICQKGRKLFGFRIQEVSTVVEISASQLQSVPTTLEAEGLISHLAQIDGKSVSFINLGVVVQP